MATAVYKIIEGAYRDAGIVRRPLTGLSNSEALEGVDVLNRLIDNWQAEELMVYCRARTVWPINANQSDYVIGLDVGGGIPDYQTRRPERIDRAGFLYTNLNPVIEEPFVIIQEQEWSSLSPKNLQSTIPTHLYYLASVPNGLIQLFPVPTQNWAMALYLWTVLEQVEGVDSQIDLPPAYLGALQSNLAVALSARYPQFPISPLTVAEARLSKSRVKNINHEPLLMQCEIASMGVQGQQSGQGRYSIFSNGFIR